MSLDGDRERNIVEKSSPRKLQDKVRESEGEAVERDPRLDPRVKPGTCESLAREFDGWLFDSNLSPARAKPNRVVPSVREDPLSQLCAANLAATGRVTAPPLRPRGATLLR